MCADKRRSILVRVLVYGMSDNMGGIESYILNYYRHMDHQLISFDFVTDYTHIAHENLLKDWGCAVYHIPKKKAHIAAHIRELRKLLQQHAAYDLLYCNVISASVLITLLGTRHTSVHTPIVHSHNDSAHHILSHVICKNLLRFKRLEAFACSYEAGKFMFGNRKFRVINNAIEVDSFRRSSRAQSELQRECAITDSQLIVGHIGKFCYQKNTLFLLHVFAKLVEIQPNSVLLLVGEGEDYDKVKALIKLLDIEKQVRLLGRRSDIPDLLQVMDVFLLPSRFEGFPLVGVEAQAAGVPCLFSSEITQAIAITDLVEFQSLKASPEVWAASICSVAEKGKDHTAYKDIIEAGYDIAHEAQALEQLFIQLKGHNV